VTFSILHVGRNGMAAQQFGSHVSSHNATNAATPGYTRRTAHIEAVPPPPQGGGGARALGSRRVVDQMLERRLLGARSEDGAAQGRSQVTGPMDLLFADGPGDLAESILDFENALTDLASHPAEPGARAAVLGAAESLAASFRRTSEALSAERETANERIAGEVTLLNERIDRIATLGEEIAKAELSGHEASDLRDQRDELVREVADQVPVRVFERDDGQITLLMDGSVPLVDEDGNAFPLDATLDPGTGDVVITRREAGLDVDVTGHFSGGRLGGLFEARDGILADTRTALDQLAFDFADAYNTAHSAGFALDGVAGRNLFEPAAAVDGAAASFAISADVAGAPENLAAASAAGDLPGDNRNALALQALSTAGISGGETSVQAYAALVADVGVAARSAAGDVERSAAALSQVQGLRDSVSGVSTDEEMVNLMQFQRGYQATLRVIQTADEMLSELMNLKR